MCTSATDAERGSLMIGVLVLLMTLSAFLLAAAHGVVNDTDAATRARARMQAFYVAESGLQYAFAQAALDSSWPGLASPGRNCKEGNFTVSVVRTDASGTALPANEKRYVATGTVNGAAAQTALTLAFN